MFTRLLLALTALTALPAMAATQYYYTGAGTNTESAFDTVTGLLTDYTFTGEVLTAPNNYSLLDAGPTGVDFYGFFTNNVTPGALTIVGSTLQGTSSNSGATGTTMRIDVPNDVTAIGLHLTGTGGATQFCFEAPGTTSCDTSLVFGSGDNYFFGIISDTAIGSFQIRNKTNASRLVVQSFEVATAAPPESGVPEPSTMALVGCGLILFPVIARRKRRQ